MAQTMCLTSFRPVSQPTTFLVAYFNNRSNIVIVSKIKNTKKEMKNLLMAQMMHQMSFGPVIIASIFPVAYFVLYK